jgi:hypothetical protein
VCYMPSASHPFWFDHPNNIWIRVQIMEVLIMHFFSSLLSLHPSYIQMSLSTLFSNTTSLCSSFNARDQVSQPHKPTGKIVVLYILFFTFLDSGQKILKCMVTTILQM